MMSLIQFDHRLVYLGQTKKHKTTLFFGSLSNLILKTMINLFNKYNLKIMEKSTTIFKFFQKKKNYKRLLLSSNLILKKSLDTKLWPLSSNSSFVPDLKLGKMYP